jgi:exosortase E/protease (VPEID-CTERM system)
VWIFLCSYLWVSRAKLRFPRAFLLLPIGTAAVWCANVLRIVTLIIIGDLWSPTLAVGAFHTRMGWVLFCAIALGLVAMIEHSKWLAVPLSSAPKVKPHNLAVPLVAPLFLVLMTQLVVGAFVVEESQAYPFSFCVGALALWRFREHYRLGALRPSGSAALVGILVFVVWVALDQSSGAGTGEAALSLLERDGSKGALVSLSFLLSTTLIAPIAEELAFRGYIMRRLVSSSVNQVKLGTYTFASTVGSAVLFGAMHDRWFVGTLAGLAYGLLTCREKRLAPAIQAHALTNALLVIWALV